MMKPEKLQIVCALIAQEKIVPHVDVKTMYETMHGEILSQAELNKLTNREIIELSAVYIADYLNNLADYILTHQSND